MRDGNSAAFLVTQGKDEALSQVVVQVGFSKGEEQGEVGHSHLQPV